MTNPKPASGPTLALLATDEPIPPTVLASYPEHVREYVQAGRDLLDRIGKGHEKACGHPMNSSAACMLTEACDLIIRLTGKNIPDGERYIVCVALMGIVATAAARIVGVIPGGPDSAVGFPTPFEFGKAAKRPGRYDPSRN